MKIEDSILLYPETDELNLTLIKIREAQHYFKFF